jgi:hypothetical protein
MACNQLAVMPGVLYDAARLITSAHNMIKRKECTLDLSVVGTILFFNRGFYSIKISFF